MRLHNQPQISRRAHLSRSPLFLCGVFTVSVPMMITKLATTSFRIFYY
jgi:hypothetical protein